MFYNYNVTVKAICNKTKKECIKESIGAFNMDGFNVHSVVKNVVNHTGVTEVDKFIQDNPDCTYSIELKPATKEEMQMIREF